MKKFLRIVPFAALLIPGVSFAQTLNTSYFVSLISSIRTIVNNVVPLLIGLGVVAFFIQIIKYIGSKDDANKKQKAIKGIFFALLAIFIMLGFMGIINILNNAAGGNVVGQQLAIDQNQGVGNPGSLRGLILQIVQFISKQVIPLMVGVAVVVFLFQLIQFIRTMDNDKEHAKFGNYVMYSLLALFVLLGVWGIAAMLVRSFFPGAAVVIPQLPTQ